MSDKVMDQIVSLCKRRGFVFQNSEIYGGQNGFWDYGPLGTELKRNVRNSWYNDMVSSHDELTVLDGAPKAFSMVGVETALIMHPQVWKCSGHFDLFNDMRVDCRECRARYRADHLRIKVARSEDGTPLAAWAFMPGSDEYDWSGAGDKKLAKSANDRSEGKVSVDANAMTLANYTASLQPNDDTGEIAEHLIPRCPNSSCRGPLTDPREFNLMFKTIVGALGTDDDAAFLRPETAQGIFVNFKNVVDSTRVKVPFGIAQVGKSFRNEITPRNFTFRSREFEQMEMEFFCHPNESQQWYTYWRDRRFAWYKDLGISDSKLILRDHTPEELAHYSIGTADVEYAFPFLAEGEYGELEGIAHRGDFDLRSHMEGKLVANDEGCLVVESNEHGQPKYRGSGKDLSYFDDQSRERFVPHVIEPAAGADRATLAFICEAYTEDEQPDEHGKMQKRVLMKLDPRLAPIKVAVLPLIKKEGMPETAQGIYRDFKAAGINAVYDQQAAIGRRYRRQDEIGTPFCMTVDGETAKDQCVTVRDRDSLAQERIPMAELVNWVRERLK